MKLDWNTIAPALLSVVAVMIGWGLKEISELFRGSSEDRRIRRKGLYLLIRLHHEMIRVERVLEQVKDASGDWRIFERFRSRYAERYGDRSDEFLNGVKATIEKVGEADPWSAMELRQVLETYVSFKDLKLEALHQAGFETYIRGLSSIEAAFMTAIQALRKIICSEARRCGIGTWLRTVLAFRTFDKLSKQVDVTGLSTDLKKHFDTLQKQAAEQAGAEQPATRSESKSEGNEKRHPEAEGRSQ